MPYVLKEATETPNHTTYWNERDERWVGDRMEATQYGTRTYAKGRLEEAKGKVPVRKYLVVEIRTEELREEEVQFEAGAI